MIRGELLRFNRGAVGGRGYSTKMGTTSPVSPLSFLEIAPTVRWRLNFALELPDERPRGN
jgi:hypothetical protein